MSDFLGARVIRPIYEAWLEHPPNIQGADRFWMQVRWDEVQTRIVGERIGGEDIRLMARDALRFVLDDLA